MYVEIRPISAWEPALLEMLKFEACRMIHALNRAGITLGDDCVKIWVKQHPAGAMYPKIEFDCGRQELQCDMTANGEIREIHCKRFEGPAGKTRRYDISEAELIPALKTIDRLIRAEYNFAPW